MTGKKDGSSETECENEQTDPLDRRIQVEDELRQEHAVAQATRKPSIWAKTDESPYRIILTGGALFGRILRASRCCHVIRQCARSAREKTAGVKAGGELSGACTVTRWLRCHRIQARRGCVRDQSPNRWDGIEGEEEPRPMGAALLPAAGAGGCRQASHRRGFLLRGPGF